MTDIEFREAASGIMKLFAIAKQPQMPDIKLAELAHMEASAMATVLLARVIQEKELK